MDLDALNDIIDYINFLREIGYSVSISSFHDVLKQVLPTLVRYEFHISPLCSYLKSFSKTKRLCLMYKEMVKRSSHDNIYYSCCWTGAEEFIVPIISSDALICRIHISGYRDKLEKSKQISKKRIQYFGDYFKEMYETLSTEVPNIDTISKITKPFKYMFHNLYEACLIRCDSQDKTLEIYTSAIRYINMHYMDDLTIENIAKALNCSSAYLRSIFAKQGEKTIIKYLNSVRFDRALNLLKYTNTTITNIAYECGFKDSNYFATAFKKKYGITPTRYRKEAQS